MAESEVTVGLKRSRTGEDTPTASGDPRSNPDERYCNYYVTRKHRFCKTARKPGCVYCPTHLVGSPTPGAPGPDDNTPGADAVRVPCPINPNHTVFASRLEKHVKVCPDLRYVTAKLPYFAEDKHGRRGEGVYTRPLPVTETVARVTHRDLSADALAALMHKVSTYYRQRVEPQLLDVSDLGPCEDAHKLSASSEARSQKHGPQHAALLQCVLFAWRRHQATSAATSEVPRDAQQPISGFLELGAGKGGLSVALQQVLTHDTPADDDEPTASSAGGATSLASCTVASPRLIVVDLDGFRRKGDARVSHSSLRLERWRINIKDLHLTAAFRASRDTSTRDDGPCASWVALGKHLCGACTDFALSCLAEESLRGVANVSVDAIVLATCCHHRCELRHMNPVKACMIEATSKDTGDAVIRLPDSDVHLTETEFAALTTMSSWSVSGDVVSEARRDAGFHCKRVLDAMRVAYLREQGYHAELCVYTTRDITEENVCIVAWKPEVPPGEALD